MTISRLIDGKEYKFELTEQELRDAYAEQEAIYDEMNVKEYLFPYDDEYFEQNYGLTVEQVEEKISEIAAELRRNLDKYDMRFEDAMDTAIATIL